MLINTKETPHKLKHLYRKWKWVLCLTILFCHEIFSVLLHDIIYIIPPISSLNFCKHSTACKDLDFSGSAALATSWNLLWLPHCYIPVNNVVLQLMLVSHLYSEWLFQKYLQNARCGECSCHCKVANEELVLGKG